MMDVEIARIARLNDLFRASGFGFMMTRGVQALEEVHNLIEFVRRYDAFTPDNDPYGEHDFGSFE